MARGNGIVGNALKPGSGFLGNIASNFQGGLKGVPSLRAGSSTINFKGKPYTYGGTGANGNPIWNNAAGAAHPAPGHISNAWNAGGGKNIPGAAAAGTGGVGGARPMFGGENGRIRFTPGKGLKRGLYGGVAGSVLPGVGTGVGAGLGALTGTFGTAGTGLLGAGALYGGAKLLGGGGGSQRYGIPPYKTQLIPGVSNSLLGGLGGAALGAYAGNAMGMGGLIPGLVGGIAGYKYLPQMMEGGSNPLAGYSRTQYPLGGQQ